ncbi:MAG: hypothetical protein GTO45_23045 [Candidatus Aminicenantes bacterium]|nr:hypothetical protein [Candidatus Aminicenantes bacterium]NIN87641.1 hypothetical protein [Candidatus Aminicenantes bacterium]
MDLEYDDQELTIDANSDWAEYRHNQALKELECYHDVQAVNENYYRTDPEDNLDENWGDHKFKV